MTISAQLIEQMERMLRAQVMRPIPKTSQAKRRRLARRTQGLRR